MSGTPARPAAALPMPQFLTNLAAGANVPDVFANQMRVGVTLTDFTIVFGVSIDSPMGGQSVVDKAIIRLAPGMLKQLLANLQMAVSAYEEVFGTIPAQKRYGNYMESIKKLMVETLQKNLAGPSDAEIAAIDHIRTTAGMR